MLSSVSLSVTYMVKKKKKKIAFLDDFFHLENIIKYIKHSE